MLQHTLAVWRTAVSKGRGKQKRSTARAFLRTITQTGVQQLRSPKPRQRGSNILRYGGTKIDRHRATNHRFLCACVVLLRRQLYCDTAAANILRRGLGAALRAAAAHSALPSMLARPVPPPPLCCGWRAPSRLSRGLACPASAGGGSEPPSVAAEKGKDADKKKKKKKKSAADGGSGGKKAAASASPATGAAPPNFPSLSLRGASSAIPSGDMYLDVDVFLTEDAEAEPQPAWAADAKRVAASLEAAAPALLAAVLAAPHPPPALRAVADAAKGCELSVALCSDAYIASLNVSWRSVDGPTDVLSFPQMTSEDGGPGVGEGGVGGEAEGEGNGGAPSASSSFLLPGGHALLGDIVISVETAARQAAARGASVEQEAQARAPI